MWALILVIVVQNGLYRDIVNIRIDGEPQAEADCWKRVPAFPVLLPLQPGNSARWQYATCVKVLP